MGVSLTTYKPSDDPPSDDPLFRLKLRPLFVEISSDVFSTLKVLIFRETFPVEQKTQKLFIFPIKVNLFPPKKKKESKAGKKLGIDWKKVIFPEMFIHPKAKTWEKNNVMMAPSLWDIPISHTPLFRVGKPPWSPRNRTSTCLRTSGTARRWKTLRYSTVIEKYTPVD